MMVLLEAAGHYSDHFVGDEGILDLILLIVVVGCHLGYLFSSFDFRRGHRASGARGGGAVMMDDVVPESR